MPSPTLSSEELNARCMALLHERPNAQLMACRPADWNDYPVQARPEALGMYLAPLDPGWIDLPCEVCGITCRMGPRQRSQHEGFPGDFLVLDMLCAARCSGLAEAHSGTATIRHLGGR
jgi:hypothetical protein